MLNENIKKLRMLHHLSQVELAAELGVSKQCVSNWENDNVQPSIEMLIKIVKFFDVSCDYILDLSEKNCISTDGLSDSEIAHIKLIVNDLKNK